MLNIAICDDELDAINKLDEILRGIAARQMIKIEIEGFTSGLSLLHHMESDKNLYDLIYLDIEMNQMDGLETAKKIRKMNERVYLIYVTGYDKYALRAYEVHPYNFIVKPVSEDSVEDSFLSVYERIQSDGLFFEYQYNKNYYKIPVIDILYFESDKRRIKIHLTNGKIQTYYNRLNLIEKELSDNNMGFWRIHQSFLINVRHIRHISFDYVELSDNACFKISKNRRKDINEQYLKMIERQFTK